MKPLVNRSTLSGVFFEPNHSNIWRRFDSLDCAIDRAIIDKKAMTVAFNAVKAGAEMFNDGNLEGCLRLYEGTLLALEPFLDHTPLP